MKMKIFVVKFLIKHGLLPEEELKVEIPVPATETSGNVKLNAMMLVGFVLAVLTQALSDNRGGVVCHMATSVSVTVSCDGLSRKVYESSSLIPCNGREHHLWLLNIRKSIHRPLETFPVNAALHDQVVADHEHG